MRRTRRASAVLAAVLTAMVVACAPGEDASGDAAPAESPSAEGPSVDARPADESLADSAVVGLPPAREGVEDDSTPLLPGEGEPRGYRLLLVNRLEGDAYVFASAGAARVALDTVPRADSLFVDIRLRADQVDLEAEDRSGRVVSATSLDLVRARVNRWEMTPDTSPHVASRCGAVGSRRCNSSPAASGVQELPGG